MGRRFDEEHHIGAKLIDLPDQLSTLTYWTTMTLKITGRLCLLVTLVLETYNLFISTSSAPL